MNGQLKKQIGLYGLTMVAVGSCIGSGIFITPRDIAAQLGDPLLIIGVWLLGGVVAITGSLTFAELGARLPKAGGVYVYIREAFGKLWAFLYGWTILTVITSGAIAALSLTFAEYLGEFVSLDSKGSLVVAVAAIVAVTTVNVFGIKYGEIFTNFFTSLKLLGILLIVGVGLFYGHAISGPEVAVDTATAVGGGSIGLAMIGVLWSFGGWHHASYLSAEVKNAPRVVPRAMILGAVIVTITYIASNLGYMRLLNVGEIATSSAVAADALETVTPIGGKIIAAMIALSVFGSIVIFTMSAPRIYFRMGEDGTVFKALSKIHPRYGTPHIAIIVQSVWAIMLLFLWGTFEKVITSVVFMDWVFMILAALAIFVFRGDKASVPGYRTPGYPLIPIIFIAVSGWFVFDTLLGRPVQAIWGLGLLLVGFADLPFLPTGQSSGVCAEA